MIARGKSRWWRWPLYGLLALLGLLLVVAGLLQTSFAREQVRIRVNAALQPMFEGRIQIDRLGRMGLSGVAGVDARVFDPEGKQVIRVQGLEARAALHVLAWELAFGGPSPQLEIERVRIDFADVTLRSDEELGVTVARAFMPVESSTPEEPSEGSVELRIPAIELGRVWAHGHAGGSPPLDANLLELRADLTQARDGFMLELQRTELLTRGLPGAAEPRGTVWGAIDVPSEEGRPLKLEGYVDGHAAGSPLWLETSWVGDDLYARVSLPRLPASYVNEQASGLALQGELTVLAEVQGSLPELELNADVQGDAAHVAVHAEAVLADGLEAVAAVAASGVNLAGVVQGAPPSRLDARVSAFLLEGEDGQYSGAHRVEIGQGVLAGVATPPAWVNGGLALGSDGRLEARGNWHASDAGAELGGLYGVSLHDSPKDVVTASAQGTLRDPARLDSLGIRTAGSVRARAEFWPNTERIDAKLDLSLGHLDYQMLQARSVEVQASATGSVKHPRVHAATTLELFSGRAHADLLYADDSQELSLFLANLDGQRLARALGVELPFEPANLNLDAHLTRKPGTRLPMKLDGTLRADFGEIGSVRLTARQLALPSNPGKGSELIGASGELVAQGRLDLAKVKKLGELVGMPLERTTGIVRFELAGRRSETAAEPELSLLVDTNGLRIVERRALDEQITTTAEAVDNQPFALEGIDAHASVRFLPERRARWHRDRPRSWRDVGRARGRSSAWPALAGESEPASAAARPARAALGGGKAPPSVAARIAASLRPARTSRARRRAIRQPR